MEVIGVPELGRAVIKLMLNKEAAQNPGSNTGLLPAQFRSCSLLTSSPVRWGATAWEEALSSGSQQPAALVLQQLCDLSFAQHIKQRSSHGYVKLWRRREATSAICFRRKTNSESCAQHQSSSPEAHPAHWAPGTRCAVSASLQVLRGDPRAVPQHMYPYGFRLSGVKKSQGLLS